MNNVGRGPKRDAAFRECLEHGVNIGDAEVDHGPSLAGLISLGDTNEQSNVSRLEEAHLGRRREEEPKTERIPIKSDCPIQVFHRDEELPDRRVR